MGWMWKSSAEKLAVQQGTEAAFWKSSGAVLHERRMDGVGSGGEQRDGGQYSGSKREVELRRMENAYGRVSFLQSSGGKIGIEVARKNAYKEEQLPVSSGKLNTDRTVQVAMGGGHGYVDSHDQQGSAFRWEERASAAPERIMSQLRRLSVELDQHTVQDMMPEAAQEQQVHGHSPFFGKMEAEIRTLVEEIRAKKGVGTVEKEQLEESQMSAEKQAAESWIQRLNRVGHVQQRDDEDTQDTEDVEDQGDIRNAGNVRERSEQ